MKLEFKIIVNRDEAATLVGTLKLSGNPVLYTIADKLLDQYYFQLKVANNENV
jgi:hypothetical protein